MSSKILTFLKLFLRSGSSSVVHFGIKYCIPLLLVCFFEAGCLVGSKATSMKLLIAIVTNLKGFRLGSSFSLYQWFLACYSCYTQIWESRITVQR